MTRTAGPPRTLTPLGGGERSPIDLSVCIVNHGNIGFLQPCLESIFAQTQGLMFEVIVVDNNSNDGSVAVIQREFPAVRLIDNKVTRSYTPNMNQAVLAARGRYIALLNDDTRLTDNGLRMMTAFLASNPAFGAVGPKLVNADGSFQMGPRGAATLWTLVCWDTCLDRLFSNSRTFAGFSMTYWDPGRSREMETASGACVVVRREVFETVGLLEENIPLGPDDVELSHRMRRAGWRLHYLADAIVIHYGSVSRSRAPIGSVLQNYDGLYWILARYSGRRAAAAFRVSVTVGAILRVGFWSIAYLLAPRSRSRAADRIRIAWSVVRANLRPGLASFEPA